MKTDVNGCSTTAAGQEQWEEYTYLGREMVQYDYRTPQGKLFSCVAPSLDVARARRDAWLVKQSAQQSLQSDGAEAVRFCSNGGKVHTGGETMCPYPPCR